MTSEVCVMNRHAVVLAADSATTVTGWTDGQRVERYFKGANKIFQLSKTSPIALMIFDSADYVRVPWEIIAKEFRASLGPKSFNRLEEYAEEFFRFLEESRWLFPDDIQKQEAIAGVRVALIRSIIDANRDEVGDKKAFVIAEAHRKRGIWDATPPPPRLSEEIVTASLLTWREDVVEILKEFRAIFPEVVPDGDDDLVPLAETAVIEVLKNPSAYLSTTGLVFAGYGNIEVFPSAREYACAGMISGKVLVSAEAPAAVDHEVPAFLKAYAQTSMSDTFTMGVAEDVFRSVATILTSHLSQMAEEICGLAAVDRTQIAGLDEALEQRVGRVLHDWLDHSNKEHSFPLRRVLSVLPIPEMVELAETLINLQSLKEKVTKPSASVGGPVDVAVITRGEGLVWIKRKHYFNSDINPSYQHRQALTYR